MEHYLDNAATTRPCVEAVAAVNEMLEINYGNPSSTHKMGLQAEHRLNQAREEIAQALKTKSGEIYFTSGGTEADNWAVIRGAEMGSKFGRHIITTAIEHDAVLNSVRYLESIGYEATYLLPDSSGNINLHDLQKAIRPDTVLISMMLVNNETGTILPVKQATQIIRSSGCNALIHTDAVQGFLKIPFTPASLGVDMITLSGHKIHGPKGVGALWIKPDIKLPPLIFGGGQEQGRRSGTEGLPQIAGFGAAAKKATEDFESNRCKMLELRKLAESRLLSQFPDITIIGGGAPHILCFSIPGPGSEVLMNFLESRGVYVSKGSACKKGRRSHVLTAMNLDPKIIDSAIRVSFSSYSTTDDVDALIYAVSEARQLLKY